MQERRCEARELDLFLFGKETETSKAVEACEDPPVKFYMEFPLCQSCIDGLEGLALMKKKQTGQ